MKKILYRHKKLIFSFQYIPLVLLFTFMYPSCDKSQQQIEENEKSSSNEVNLPPSAVQVAGIRTYTITMRPMQAVIQAPGEVIFDPRHIQHLSARLTGRLERLSAYVGDHAQAGQELAALYSPEFITSQKEFLNNKAILDNQNQAVVRAARARLQMLGLADSDLVRLEVDGTDIPLLPIRAPFSGTIVESDAVTGKQVEYGTSLFKIADPHLLWILASFRETSLPSLTPGLSAQITSPAWPKKTFTGRLLSLDASMNSNTRSIIGRILIEQREILLRPGMYVDVQIKTPETSPAITIPEQSVRSINNQTVVFVAQGKSYVKRQVEIGVTIDGWVAILSGLEPGETVVSDGSFALKSELMKSSLAEEE